MDPAATALAQAAEELHDAARSHKRAAGQHRRQAKDLMQRFEALAARCAELGIDINVNTHHSESD